MGTTNNHPKRFGKGTTMKTATFTKDGKTIRATATCSAGMGFIANLVCRGWYTEAEAFDLCYEYQDVYVTIEEC